MSLSASFQPVKRGRPQAKASLILFLFLKPIERLGLARSYQGPFHRLEFLRVGFERGGVARPPQSFGMGAIVYPGMVKERGRGAPPNLLVPCTFFSTLLGV